MYYEMYVYRSFLQTPLKVIKTSENSSILSSCEIFCGYVVKQVCVLVDGIEMANLGVNEKMFHLNNSSTMIRRDGKE